MLPDPNDIASEQEELTRQAALAKRQPTGPQPNGRCHWCDEVVDDHQRWCDADCRDMWQREHGK